MGYGEKPFTVYQGSLPIAIFTDGQEPVVPSVEHVFGQSKPIRVRSTDPRNYTLGQLTEMGNVVEIYTHKDVRPLRKQLDFTNAIIEPETALVPLRSEDGQYQLAANGMPKYAAMGFERFKKERQRWMQGHGPFKVQEVEWGSSGWDTKLKEVTYKGTEEKKGKARLTQGDIEYLNGLLASKETRPLLGLQKGKEPSIPFDVTVSYDIFGVPIGAEWQTYRPFGRHVRDIGSEPLPANIWSWLSGVVKPRHG